MKEGWTYKKLGEVCEIFGRIGFRGYTKADLVDSPNDGAITLSPSNIVNGEMDYSKCSYITWAKYEESPEIMIYPGDILLVKTASVGKTALVRDLPHKATINPQFVVFKNIETNHDYLSYYMKSEKAQKYIWSIAKGAAAQTVSQKNLAEMQVPVPTKAEQQRIVSRLDSAFAHIDELKANAEKQLSEARTLFQKALTKAMEPKEGWEERKIREISLIKGGKRVPQGYKLETEKTDYPYIRVADFTDEGTIDLSDIHYINNSVYQQIKNYTITDKDIYISIAGTIGKSGIIPSCLNGANLTENACKLVLNGGIEQRYVYWFTKSDEFKGQISLATRQTSQPKLALTRLAEVCISLPPLTEQRRIVSRLDSLSAHVRELEEVTQKTIAECDALKQALLRKVFE